MILTINHETVYRYDEAVRFSTQYLRLTPRSDDSQRILEWRLDLPTPAVRGEDHFGNITHMLILDMPHREIRIRATGLVETEAGERMSFDGDPLVYLRSTLLTGVDAILVSFAARFRRQPMTLAALDALADAVHRYLPYVPGHSGVQRTAAEAFRAESGASQDHAQVFISCCRHLGVPARYVSGYVHSPGHDDLHMASHAWAEAWLEDRWWSFDIVNRCRAGEGHLRLATGMDYLDACPVRGVRRGGCGEMPEAQMSVFSMEQATHEADHSAASIAQQQQQQ